METARPARPVRGRVARHERIFTFGLVAILTLGLASPAQAGLGDLLDPVIEEQPVVDDIVDPILEVADPVVEVVEPVLAPVVDPLVEVLAPVVEEVVDPVVEVLAPVVEEVVDPVVEDVVDPVVEVIDPVVEVVDPVVEVVDPAVEHVTAAVGLVDPVVGEPPAMEEVALYSIESDAASVPSLQTDEILNDVDDHGSLVLAQTLQAALAGTRGTLPTVAGALVDTSGGGWLTGLIDWLRGAANRLVDLLSVPLRLLEILIRALLTAGSGLVAPASLALAFTIYAVRDRRWQGLRKAVLN